MYIVHAPPPLTVPNIKPPLDFVINDTIYHHRWLYSIEKTILMVGTFAGRGGGGLKSCR